jgi:L-ascorbate 6-phosphate lactonase
MHVTPPGSVTLWWLGQSGFLLKTPLGLVIALDPYLTNSCGALGAAVGLNMDRQVPPLLPPAGLVGIDLYVVTHSHQDHLDPETLLEYRRHGGRGPYLAPAESAEKLRSLGVPDEEITMTWPNRIFASRDLEIRATFAIPFAGDDLTHVGYLMSVDQGPKIYFTGDTAYHEVLSAAVQPHQPDLMVSVINGAYRNLGPAEAARLTRELGVRKVIPCHYDLFPDNGQSPRMLRTCLLQEGIVERFELLEHGVPYTFSAKASGVQKA